MSKYGNRKTEVDNITFDSKREAMRYTQLKMLLRGNAISNLEFQPRFVLQEAFVDNTGKKHKPIVYVADFSYIDDLGRQVIEDVKGMQTEKFKLKLKLFLYKYPEKIFIMT